MDSHSIMTHLKPLWLIGSAGLGFLLAIIYTIRYKLPDMNKRLACLEKTGAKAHDIQAAIDSFHTVCRFNQVSCQKEIQENTAALVKELDNKLGQMYSKMNALAVCNAALSATVERLIKERENGTGNKNH